MRHPHTKQEETEKQVTGGRVTGTAAPLACLGSAAGLDSWRRLELRPGPGAAPLPLVGAAEGTARGAPAPYEICRL